MREIIIIMLLSKYLKDFYGQDITFIIIEVKIWDKTELIAFNLDITIIIDVFKQGNSFLYSLRSLTCKYSRKVEWYPGIFANLIFANLYCRI